MERSIAIFAVINFTIIGLSHLFQQQAWKEFFRVLHAQGRPGAFANGFLTLATGSLIVAFHNVWSGLPTVLTLIGWAYLAKSAAIFLNPDWNVRSMGSVQSASALKFQVAGFVLLSVAAVLAFAVLFDGYRSPTVSLGQRAVGAEWCHSRDLDADSVIDVTAQNRRRLADADSRLQGSTDSLW